MNGPFIVAQATGTTPGPGLVPPRIIKVIKPESGQAVVLQASYDGSVKVDFTAVANEQITLVHMGE